MTRCEAAACRENSRVAKRRFAGNGKAYRQRIRQSMSGISSCCEMPGFSLFSQPQHPLARGNWRRISSERCCFRVSPVATAPCLLLHPRIRHTTHNCRSCQNAGSPRRVAAGSPPRLQKSTKLWKSASPYVDRPQKTGFRQGFSGVLKSFHRRLDTDGPEKPFFPAFSNFTLFCVLVIVHHLPVDIPCDRQSLA